MAGLINLRLLTDFFNKIGPIATDLRYPLSPFITQFQTQCCSVANDASFHQWT
jgi:hypothetical protein